MLQSFDILWPNTILHRIVTKTNRHAQYVIDEIDNPMGIPKPNDLTIPCLKALFFNSLIYGIKIPNQLVQCGYHFCVLLFPMS
jgi:hypothetical protein